MACLTVLENILIPQQHHSSPNYSKSNYLEMVRNETALLKVTSQVLQMLDEGHTCILVLLELSTVFNTFDHGILLQRLEFTF